MGTANHRFEDFAVAIRKISSGAYMAELREVYLFAEGEHVEAAYEKLRQSYEALKVDASRAGTSLPGPSGAVSGVGSARGELRRFAWKTAIIGALVIGIIWVAVARLDQVVERQVSATTERLSRLLTDDGRVSAVDLVIRIRDRLDKLPDERKQELKDALQDIVDDAKLILPELDAEQGSGLPQTPSAPPDGAVR